MTRDMLAVRTLFASNCWVSQRKSGKESVCTSINSHSLCTLVPFHNITVLKCSIFAFANLLLVMHFQIPNDCLF